MAAQILNGFYRNYRTLPFFSQTVRRIDYICVGFSVRFAPTVLPTFQTWRLLAVGSVSGISMIILRWSEWPSEDALAPGKQECPEAPADHITPLIGSFANDGLLQEPPFS